LTKRQEKANKKNLKKEESEDEKVIRLDDGLRFGSADWGGICR
jgi:hypothetical protein